MSEKRFYREDYPLDILAEFGLSEQMIYDLPDYVHERIERGGKSPLLPICIAQPFGATRLYAKFSLINTENGIDVLFSPKLKEPQLDYFTDRDRTLLLQAKTIVTDIEEPFVDAQGKEEQRKTKVFVQLDKDTNGLLYTPTPIIGRNIHTAASELGMTDKELESMWNGDKITKSIKDDDGLEEYLTIGIDLMADKGIVIVPGKIDRWEGVVRQKMPEYSFGNDGCWINRDGKLTYISEDHFTNDILEVLQRQAQQAGISMPPANQTQSLQPDKISEKDGKEPTIRL